MLKCCLQKDKVFTNQLKITSMWLEGTFNISTCQETLYRFFNCKYSFRIHSKVSAATCSGCWQASTTTSTQSAFRVAVRTFCIIISSNFLIFFGITPGVSYNIICNTPTHLSTQRTQWNLHLFKLSCGITADELKPVLCGYDYFRIPAGDGISWRLKFWYPASQSIKIIHKKFQRYIGNTGVSQWYMCIYQVGITTDMEGCDIIRVG